MSDLRTILLAAATLLALFDNVSARSSETLPADFVATPEAGHLGSQMIGLEVYNNNQDLGRIASGGLDGLPPLIGAGLVPVAWIKKQICAAQVFKGASSRP